MLKRFISRWKQSSSELWTKNFTIISLGSVVSVAGASTVAILFGLMILDLTDSPIYYSVLLAIGNIAGVIVPILCGSFLERCAKERVIYSCDFCSAALFAVAALIYKLGWVNGPAVLLMSLCFETISRIYQTDYLSLLPYLVKEEHYQKAYSITSLIENIGSSACLVGILGYDIFGAFPILIFCSVCFFVAACFETQIRPEEMPSGAKKKPSSVGGLKAHFRDYGKVLAYLRKIPGMIELLVIWLFNYLHLGAMWAMLLPYFKYVYTDNILFGFEIGQEYMYMIFYGFYGTGQFWGSGVGYSVNIKKDKRFLCFFAFALLEGITTVVFPMLPALGAAFVILLSGFFGIYTYSMFETLIFEKIPETMRARVTGVISSLQALMMVLGNLWSGWIIEKSSYPQAGFLVTTLPVLFVVVLLLLVRGKSLRAYFAPSEKPDGE